MRKTADIDLWLPREHACTSWLPPRQTNVGVCHSTHKDTTILIAFQYTPKGKLTREQMDGAADLQTHIVWYQWVWVLITETKHLTRRTLREGGVITGEMGRPGGEVCGAGEASEQRFAFGNFSTSMACENPAERMTTLKDSAEVNGRREL